MKVQLRGLGAFERSSLDRISEKVCASAARTQNADLRKLAGGDLAAMLGDIRNEFLEMLAVRSPGLLKRSVA